jgi:hypothetical protein
VVAYAESLVTVEYLRQSWGMDGVQRILQRLADGEAPDTVVYEVTQSHYSDLEESVGNYLQKKYAAAGTE